MAHFRTMDTGQTWRHYRNTIVLIGMFTQRNRTTNWDEVVAEAGSDIDPEHVQRYTRKVWRIGIVTYEPITSYLEKRPTSEYWYEGTRTSFTQFSCVQLLFIAARAFLAEQNMIYSSFGRHSSISNALLSDFS